MNLEELLNMPEFNIFIDPRELEFFYTGHKRNCNELIHKIFSDMMSRINSIMENPQIVEEKDNDILDECSRKREDIQKRIDELEASVNRLKDENMSASERKATQEKINASKNAIIEEIDALNKTTSGILQRKFNTDSRSTHIESECVKEALIENNRNISISQLALFYGMLAKKYYTWIQKAERGEHKGYDEFCFTNGFIFSITDNRIISNDVNSERPYYSTEDIKDSLVETMLKANQICQKENKNSNKRFGIRGEYFLRGASVQGSSVLESIDSKSFSDFLKSEEFISSLNPKKIEEYIKKGYYSKNDFIKIIKRGNLPEEIVAELIGKKLISSNDNEVLKLFNVKSYKDLIKKKKYGLETAIILYSAKRITMQDLEELFKDRDDISMPQKAFWERVSHYYQDDLNKISELITHNVIDYTSSIDFLETLSERFVISEDEKKYLNKVMDDFKTDELINDTENGVREFGGISRYDSKKKGLTIDPEKRKAYLRSIGDVKELVIRGETLLQDDSDDKLDDTQKEQKKINSLDGYQVVIIPDKRVAILEKFYEVKRDKDGKIVFRKNEEGKLVPAIENATYIIPIGMARDFATRKNKQELMRSRLVRRTAHTRAWVTNTESRIKDINPEAEFNPKNTKRWSRIIEKNYDDLSGNR